MRKLSSDRNDASNSFASNQYLKTKLIQRYGDEISFTSNANKLDIVVFKWNIKNIINDAWYYERICNEEEESVRIIKTAAKLIQMQIRSMDTDMSNYPSTSKIGDVEYNKEWLPPLLKIFMESLINSRLKQASIGQTIVHATRPRSSIPPIMFGITVDCDHMFGSSWLIRTLNQLGFCLRVDEITRYNQSVVQNEKITDVLKTNCIWVV